jgi:hypothetical protein
MEGWNRKLSPAALIGALVLGVVVVAQGATILDWAEWDSAFKDGSDKKQNFTTLDGVDVEYKPKKIKVGGKPDPTFLFGTPAIAANPSSGSSGLSVQQSAKPGAGMEHAIKFGSGVQGISFTISGIDTSAGTVEEMSFAAKIVGVGGHSAPTRVIVTNSSYVSVIGGDTVRAIAGQQVPASSTDGTVQVFFDMADIEHIDIKFINSTVGTVAGVVGNMSISIGAVNETGFVSIPPPIPEPSAVTFSLLAGVLLLGRRQR